MSSSHAHAHAHARAPARGATDRRWLFAALAVIVAFMAGEVVAGLSAHSLALITDAGHMLTDAAAIALAIAASRIAQRPAGGAYTYGFARVDALSGQANGITLLLLAVWFTVEAVRRLLSPPAVHGAVVSVVAVLGVLVNLLATWLAAHADRTGLNVRGVLAHLVTDLWAFLATFVAGLVVVFSGWSRADAVASLVVAALMAWTGSALVRAAGRVFLEAAPRGLDPDGLGAELAALPGVAQVHDLHVWQIGTGEPAASAHVLVQPPHDCHEVSGRLRQLLLDRHGIEHVTLQTEHVTAPGGLAAAGESPDCTDTHGPVHVPPPG